MAGNSSSWHKVSAGPVAGQAVFIPPALVKGLDSETVEQQLAGGYGGLLNEFPPGPLVHKSQVNHVLVDPYSFSPNIQELPLVVKQVDGDHAVKQGLVQGPLAVVETPFGHSVVQVWSGQALLYANDGKPGKPKPTPKSKQLALQTMITLNHLHDWQHEVPDTPSKEAANLIAIAEKSPLGTFKASHWAKGEDVKEKKKAAPNDAPYAKALAALEQAKQSAAPPSRQAAQSAPASADPDAPPAAYDEVRAQITAAQAGPTDAGEEWPVAKIPLMPNVVDEEHKEHETVHLSPDGNFGVMGLWSGNGWAIYHVPSGYPMASSFPTLLEAQAAIEQIEPGIDWSHTSKEELFANKENFEKVVAANNQLKQAAMTSNQPDPMHAPPPPWEPEGGVASYPTLHAHEAAIQQAYQKQLGFVRSTKLKVAQMQALHAYQDGGYQTINSALWSGDPGKAHGKVKNQIKNLDHAMSLSSVPENMEVVRSAATQHPLYAQMANLAVGDVYETPAYDSTSINYNNQWGGGAVRITYRLPKGAKAVFMNALSSSPNAKGYTSTHTGEHECLIARNSRWKVVGKTVDEDGRIEATVELVEQKKPTDL